jgi:hypothetical protein
MGILDKILRRKPTHEQWLESHPGKGRVTMEAPGVSASEEAATRSRMEDELDVQRDKRNTE